MMNVNGINKNGINETGYSMTPDKIADVIPKEVQSTATENKSQEIISSAQNVEPITYEDQVLKTAGETVKKEETETTNEEEQWKNSGERLTKEDYEDLSKEGISLEEYTLEQMERALLRIKNQRIFKENGLEKQKQKIENKGEAIERMANYDKGNKKVVQKLIDADLPITEENIEKLQNALERATASTPISEKAAAYLIKNNQTPTIENIYKAQYSGIYQSNPVSEEAWNGLLGQVKDIIRSSGLEVNDETMQSAKWLINHNLPLTEDTLGALGDINTINKGIEEDAVLTMATQALMNGKSAESASLGTLEAKKVEELVTALQNISEEAIDLIIDTYKGQADYTKQINCRMFIEAQQQIEKQAVADTKAQSQQEELPEYRSQEEKEIDIKSITIRRQLEEIRLKMTIEAGRQLVKNGIQPNTDSLSRVVEGLKEIEDQYYRGLLKEGNTADTVQNIETLKASIQGIEDLKGMPNYILGSTLENRSQETVSGLLAAGTECKQSLEKAKEAYETLMTAPRSDMGDSISKAFRNVDTILEDMKLEVTNANQRAVRILGYNQMEITKENIEQVKAFDEQVNHLIKNLHPAVTVELIKKGINPINTPIEELNQQVDEAKSSMGVSQDEKYSKYLWKLEKEKGITKEEKKSYIGIYRLLNMVEKTDGAALGAVIKADQEITMQNLLTAVRTINRGGIRADVDDTFGALEEFKLSGEQITDQIRAAFQSATQPQAESEINQNPGNTEDKVGYMNQLLQSIMEEIAPAKLQSLGEPSDILNMSMEKLRENLLDVPDNEEAEQEYWTEKALDYKTTVKQSENALKFLNDYAIPGSIHNIQAANDILSLDQTVYRQWKSLLKKDSGKPVQTDAVDTEHIPTDIETMSEGLIHSLTDQDSMVSQYSKIDQGVSNQLSQYIENEEITSQDITTLQRISNGFSFLQQLARRECFEIPLAVGDKVTNVNVTILRNTGETGKVDISIQSDTLGKITVGLSMKEQAVKGLITCDNRAGLEAIRSNSEILKEAIEESGIEVKQLHYGIENKAADVYRYKYGNQDKAADADAAKENTAVSTNKLYSLAKTMVMQIREIETKNM